MILENTASKVETNVENHHRFTMTTNPKLFQLLSDNLYSNKIGSIVRELSSNARDSHIEANNSDPFEIFLPNSLNPIFKIKDYGIGMSKETIYDIFTCYGESTKTNSNDVVGAFGLGSKTPFSYRSSFSITSIHNKKKSSYTVYIDSEGYPAITEMFSIDTLERNGFEIFFSVEEEDFYSFRRECASQLKYFDFNYKIDDIYYPEFKFDDILYEDDNCAFTQCSGYRNNPIKVIFGGICYNTTKKITGIELYLKFNIGDIDVSVSRESIAYTDKTEEKIDKKYNEAVNLFKEKLIKEFEHIEYEYDYYAEIFKKYARNDWIIEHVFEAYRRFRYNIEKYDYLKFYDPQDKKINKEIMVDFYYKRPKFRIYNLKDNITIKWARENTSSNEFLIYCDPKFKAECQKELNQLLIEIDSKDYISYFTEEDFKKFKEEKKEIKKEKESIEFCKIGYTHFTQNFTFNGLFEKIDYFYFVKFKNNIIDIETEEVLFHNGSELQVLSDILEDGKNRILIFTKANFKRFKETEEFKKCKEGKQAFIDKIKTYDIVIFKNNSLINNSFFLKIKDSLEDDILKRNIQENNKMLSYDTKSCIMDKKWTGFDINIEKIDKEIEDLNKKYYICEEFNHWNVDGRKQEYIDIVNFIHRRSLKNES